MDLGHILKNRREEEAPLKQSLITPEKSKREMDRKIDMVNVVNDQKESRVTTINLKTFKPFDQARGRKFSDPQAMRRIQNYEDEEMSPEPRGGGARISMVSEHESFMGVYQNNSVIGIIIYLLFIPFVAGEVIIASYCIPEGVGHSRFGLQKAIITIQSAQVLYYMISRYFNSRADRKFIKTSSIGLSFKKMFRNNYSRSHQNSPKKTYMYLITITVSLMLAELIYCSLLINSNFLFSGPDQGNLVSTIFWANFALPFLIQHFYLSEVNLQGTSNLKVKIFPYIILGFMFQSLLEGSLFILLMTLKLINIYLFTKQGYDMFHIRQLIKLSLLVLVVFYAVVKFMVTDVDTSNIFNSLWSIITGIVVITAAMLVSRLVALIFMKQELNKYFYTEMHVQLAFIFATMLMYLCYFNLQSLTTIPQVYSFIALIFLSIVAVIVYMEGKQRLQINIDEIKEEEHL